MKAHGVTLGAFELQFSPIELSCESELMSGRRVSISLESEFDPESSFSVILVKVSISLESEFDPEASKKNRC